MSTRQERVSSLIKREISNIIQNEIADPRVGFVTVTDVELTRDLGHARIFVSVLGDDQTCDAAMEGLKKAQGFLRTELSRRAYLRAVPEVSFMLDQSAAQGEKIERLLTEVKREKPGILVTALESATKLVQSAHSFFIVSHVKPDGDSIGSVLAMAHMLSRTGRRVVTACEDPVPTVYRFLPNADKVTAKPEDEIFDLAIVLDCENLSRVGNLRGMVDRARSVLNLDHHPENQKFGEVSVLDPGAGATGEIVYELAQHLGIALDEEEADALYTAISTDTGRFHYANTRPKTMEIAAELIRQGASPVRVAQYVYESKRLSMVRLHGIALERTQIDLDGRLVWSGLGPADFAETEAGGEDTEGIINTLRSLVGSVIALMFTEMPPGGTTRVSFRAAPGYDVSAVARVFGGGGHHVAAGCTVEKPLAEAQALVLAECRAILRESRPNVGH